MVVRDDSGGVKAMLSSECNFTNFVSARENESTTLSGMPVP